jgi:hypothetical protein
MFWLKTAASSTTKNKQNHNFPQTPQNTTKNINKNKQQQQRRQETNTTFANKKIQKTTTNKQQEHKCDWFVIKFTGVHVGKMQKICNNVISLQYLIVSTFRHKEKNITLEC